MSLNFFVKSIARRGVILALKPPPNHLLRCTTLSISFSSRKPLKPPALIASHFHVSPPRNALPAFIVFALRYAAKAGAIISGKLIKRWWNSLSPEEKEKVLEQIRSRKSKIAFFGTVFAGFLFLYYLENIVENPITKRKRFIILSQKQLKEIGEFEYQRQLNDFRTAIVPPSHAVHRRVLRVVNSLVLSNLHLQEMRETVWSVTVVDRPDIMNAFSLPQGQIFVFTGMLNLCTNDDQLAIVLAHEMAHTILSHMSELISQGFILDLVLLVPTIILWTMFSDLVAIVSEYVKSLLSEVLITLPYTRALEREADMVGLLLAAKSCFDVREAPLFWRKMQMATKTMPVNWMSTHPSSESREKEMMVLVPSALQVRERNLCPPLSQKWRSR